jgi:hypothetical protein
MGGWGRERKTECSPRHEKFPFEWIASLLHRHRNHRPLSTSEYNVKQMEFRAYLNWSKYMTCNQVILYNQNKIGNVRIA